MVDADEIVTPELRNYLYQRVAETSCPAGLYIPRLNRFFGVYTRSIAYDYQLRFFKREGTVWPPHVHTFPKVDGPTERIPSYAKNVRLIHLADESVSDLLKKTDNYTEEEILKRKNYNYGVWALFWRPSWRFFRNYFLKLGLLDGKVGLVRAGMDALYQYVLVAKIIEKQKREHK